MPELWYAKDCSQFKAPHSLFSLVSSRLYPRSQELSRSRFSARIPRYSLSLSRLLRISWCNFPLGQQFGCSASSLMYSFTTGGFGITSAGNSSNGVQSTPSGAFSKTNLLVPAMMPYYPPNFLHCRARSKRSHKLYHSSKPPKKI